MAAAFLILSYVLTGALHGFCGLDVTAPSGSSQVTEVAANSVQVPDHGMVVDHHCHGCFSVSVPAPPKSSLRAIEPKVAVRYLAPAPLADVVRGLDPPPPKSLT
jgi:hypothetical protein